MPNLKLEHKQELLQYPIAYTLQMALENNDIISHGAASYNTSRLQEFIFNVENKIPNKVIITQYGIDDYPTIGILEYNSGVIVYTQRKTRNESNQIDFYTLYGYRMTTRLRQKYENTIKDYILTTMDQMDYVIFNMT